MYTQEDIDRWKSQYEDVFHQVIGDQVFIFRGIGRQEYQDIIDAEDNFSYIQEYVCGKVTLFPKDHDWSLTAGHADTLHSHVMELSGLAPGQARSLLDEARNQMMIFDHQLDCIIHEAFSEFTIEQIENWTVPKQMKYLARAEFILSELRGVPLQQLGIAPGEHEDQMHTQSGAEQEVAASEQQGPLSKKQVEAMLSEKAGKNISLDDETKMSSKAGSMPELAWFAASDGLTGSFG